ncbi:MAG: leucine-rich repeat domain-containing protein [Microcoleus sp.]|uniref:leucine-rich repeat domain-containing protein n=1 Tax=Microcoleus sp. TaxID=44472 RepID=UPI003C742508
MMFIAMQKYVNLSRLMVVVAFSAIGLGSCGNIFFPSVAQTQPGNKTFGDWCREKASLSPEAKHTVEVLLEKAGTTECNAANQKLSSITELDLSDNKITDIKPLQSLTKLDWLHLIDNQISDIKPLQSLTKLTKLGLGGNPISPKTCPLKPEYICNWE